MWHWQQQSLSTKLVAVYGLAVGCCLLLIGVPLHRVLRRDYVSRAAAAFEQDVRGLTGDLRQAAAAADTGQLDRLCERLNVGFDGRVSLIGAGGRVLGDSISARCAALARPECLERIREQRSKLFEQDIALRETVTVRVPLTLSDGEACGMRLALPLAPVQQQVRTMRWLLLVGACGAAVLAVAAGVFFSRRIARPLDRMTAVAERIAAGDFSLPMPDRGHDEVGRLAEALDTMRRELEANVTALTAERNQALAIVSELADGVVAVGPAGTVLFANRAGARLLGVAGGAIPAGTRLADLAAVPPAVQVAVRGALAGAPHESKLEFGDPRRGERAVQVLLRPVATGGGIVVVLRDMTEVRRAEAMGRELVTNASHELRTPLAVITSTTDTLLGSAAGLGDRQREFAGIIARQAARLQRLVEETLQMSVLEGGTAELAREAVTVADLVDEAISLHGEAARAKRHDFTVSVPEDLPAVSGVPVLLAQAVRSLVDNAIRYTPPGGRIRVEARRVGREVALGVEDNGPGIPPNEQSRVFDRFYRGRSTGCSGSEEGGTGLGLAIVARVAAAHGGRVELGSEPGRGCRFTLYLPAVEPGPPVTAAAES